MQLIKYFVLAALLIGTTQAFPQGPTLDEVIDVIFENYVTKPHNPVEKSKAENTCGTKRVCVPYYLCVNNEIVTNGTGVMDIRANVAKHVTNDTENSRKRRETFSLPETECGFLEECCNLPDEKDDFIVSPMSTVAPILNSTPSEQIKRDGCGIRHPDEIGFRITGKNNNNEAQFGEFPWMVAVLLEKLDPDMGNFTIYECNGALIAPTVVVTSANCVRNRVANTLIVRAGEWDTQSKDEILPHQNRQVRDVISHEKFNENSLYNDIALLIVGEPFEYEDNVRPICLPPATANFDLARCYASGWGKDKFGKEGKYQTILKKIELPVVPRDQCQINLRTTRLGNYFNLHESFICAGGELDQDTCAGDGGSPLVCPIAGRKDQFYQAGIVAWGIGCGNINIPGVYANVAHLRPWIDEKLSKLGVDFSHFTA